MSKFNPNAIWINPFELDRQDFSKIGFNWFLWSISNLAVPIIFMHYNASRVVRCLKKHRSPILTHLLNFVISACQKYNTISFSLKISNPYSKVNFSKSFKNSKWWKLFLCIQSKINLIVCLKIQLDNCDSIFKINYYKVTHIKLHISKSVEIFLAGFLFYIFSKNSQIPKILQEVGIYQVVIFFRDFYLVPLLFCMSNYAIRHNDPKLFFGLIRSFVETFTIRLQWSLQNT